MRDFVVLFVLHRMTANNYSVRFSEICRPGGDVDLSIPIGKRPKLYRFLEILPGSLSYGVIILLGLLLIVNSVWAWIYMRTVILLISVYLGVTAYCMVKSGLALKRSLAIDWADRLASLENPKESWARLDAQRVAEKDDRGAQEPAAVVAQPQSPQELVRGDDDIVGIPRVESADPLRQGDAVEVAGVQRRRSRCAVRIGAGEPDLLASPVAQGDAAGAGPPGGGAVRAAVEG